VSDWTWEYEPDAENVVGGLPSVSTSDFVLKLSEAVTPAGAEAALKEYLVTDRLVGNFGEAPDLIKSALDSHSSKAAWGVISPRAAKR